jgi:hypothetical protein
MISYYVPYFAEARRAEAKWRPGDPGEGRGSAATTCPCVFFAREHRRRGLPPRRGINEVSKHIVPPNPFRLRPAAGPLPAGTASTCTTRCRYRCTFFFRLHSPPLGRASLQRALPILAPRGARTSGHRKYLSEILPLSAGRPESQVSRSTIHPTHQPKMLTRGLLRITLSTISSTVQRRAQ